MRIEDERHQHEERLRRRLGKNVPATKWQKDDKRAEQDAVENAINDGRYSSRSRFRFGRYSRNEILRILATSILGFGSYHLCDRCRPSSTGAPFRWSAWISCSSSLSYSSMSRSRYPFGAHFLGERNRERPLILLSPKIRNSTRPASSGVAKSTRTSWTC